MHCVFGQRLPDPAKRFAWICRYQCRQDSLTLLYEPCDVCICEACIPIAATTVGGYGDFLPLLALCDHARSHRGGLPAYYGAAVYDPGMSV